MNAIATPPDETSRILRERAKLLAREPKQQDDPENTLEIIEFALAHESYGIEATYVLEVSPLEDLTPLPCTPAFVRGLVNLRGRILPVIDLKKFFDLPEEGITDLHRILVVRTADMEFGLLADTIGAVRDIPLDDIQPPLPTLTGIRAEYLRGVTAERLVVLDAARILADRRIIVHEEVET
ncbi:MAG TPA: chemotaxis protein CheW [Opitutus sp.]|nr:chemotaxis protein CheW [Opitutus sp.]